MKIFKFIISKLKTLFTNKTSLRFVVIGVINTLFSYSLFSILIYIGLVVEWASLFSLIFGIFFSFYTQSKFVFKQPSNVAFARFVGNCSPGGR